MVACRELSSAQVLTRTSVLQPGRTLKSTVMTAEKDLPPQGRHAQFFASPPQWPPQDMAGQSFVMGTPPVMLAPWQDQLRWQARDAIPRKEFSLAVILSQVACELHTEVALTVLLSRRLEPRVTDAVIALIRGSPALDNGHVRRLWSECTGDNPAGIPDKGIKPSEWWKAWKEARDLRDEIAHRGATVTQQQAEDAYAASAKYIEHVRSVVNAARPIAPCVGRSGSL
jgi:hypothetical protein